MTTSQTNSGDNRTADSETPPDQACSESLDSKKQEKNKKKKNKNTSQVTHPGLMKDRVLKGITISSRTSIEMTAECRVFVIVTIAFAASKSFKRWPGVLENMKILDHKVWKTT